MLRGSFSHRQLDLDKLESCACHWLKLLSLRGQKGACPSLAKTDLHQPNVYFCRNMCFFGANQLFEWCKSNVQFAPKMVQMRCATCTKMVQIKCAICTKMVQISGAICTWISPVWCKLWCKNGANCTWKMVQIAPGKRCKLHLENVQFASAIAGVGVQIQWPHPTPSKAPNPSPSK